MIKNLEIWIKANSWFCVGIVTLILLLIILVTPYDKMVFTLNLMFLLYGAILIICAMIKISKKGKLTKKDWQVFTIFYLAVFSLFFI